MTHAHPPRPAYEVIQLSSDQPDLIQACFDIRIEVFVVEQNFSIDDEIDEYDDKAVFFLLNVINEDEEGDEERTQGTGGVRRKPVGTVRFVPGLNKLGRLAILPPYRQHGFGRILVEAVHKWAVEEEAVEEIRASSQIHAIPFYQKLGYEPRGERYDEDGAPHQLMVKTILRPGRIGPAS